MSTKNNLPAKPTTRYRPKADQSTLYQLLRKAWKVKTDEWDAAHGASISSAATELLESLFSVEDMLVLQKYGKAKATESIGIRLYNHRSDRWDETCRTNLVHPVLVTDYAELSALRPKWWDEPLYGIKPENKDGMTEEEWNSVVAINEKSKIKQMPVNLDPAFSDLLDMIHASQQDSAINDWIKEKKLEQGVYPTWGEIIAHRPILLLIEEFKDWVIA